jgi:hypothetical protein
MGHAPITGTTPWLIEEMTMGGAIRKWLVAIAKNISEIEKALKKAMDRNTLG